MSPLQDDFHLSRHQIVMVQVSAKELINEISVLHECLTDTIPEQQYIFPKLLSQRILLKLDKILIPSFHLIPFPDTTFSITQDCEEKIVNNVLEQLHSLRQNLISTKGNMEIVEKQFHSNELLYLIKYQDPYYYHRLGHILHFLNIAKENAGTISNSSTSCLRYYDDAIKKLYSE